jgi:putative glutamine amidotransferase
MSQPPSNITIALGRGSGFPSDYQFTEWLQQSPYNVTTVDLWSEENRGNAVELLNTCSGLLLTGGADIDPSRYGREDERNICRINSELDDHEFAIVEKALQKHMPTLGICRGAQVLAVANGAALLQDIPQDVGTSVVHASQATEDAYHNIEITPGSILAKVTKVFEAKVNSLHHQAVRSELPEHLAVAARAADGIIEAIEWKNQALKPGFMLGIQWHPQRLDYSHPLSGAIAEHFLFEAETFQLLMQ